MSKMDKNLKNDEFDHDGKLTNLGLRRYREAVKITIGYFKENGNLVPDLMSTRQAASYLDKSQKTLEAWRRKQIGPKFYSDPHTGAVYYTRHDIREHLKLPSTHSKVAEAQEAYSVISRMFDSYKEGMRKLRDRGHLKDDDNDDQNKK